MQLYNERQIAEVGLHPHDQFNLDLLREAIDSDSYQIEQAHINPNSSSVLISIDEHGSIRDFKLEVLSNPAYKQSQWCWDDPSLTTDRLVRVWLVRFPAVFLYFPVPERISLFLGELRKDGKYTFTSDALRQRAAERRKMEKDLDMDPEGGIGGRGNNFPI